MTRRRLAALAAVFCCLLGCAMAQAEGPGAAPARPRFAFLGLHGGVFDVLAGAADRAAVEVAYLEDDALRDGAADLAAFDAVLVQHLRSDLGRALADLLHKARERRPKLRVFSLSARVPSLDGEHAATANIESDPELQAYYGTSRDNLRRMLGWLRVRVGGGDGAIEPPTPAGTVGVWHPDHAGVMDAEQFEAWLGERGGDFAGRPRVAVAVHTIHLEFQQPAVAEALVRELEKTGLCAFGVIDAAEGLQALRLRYEAMLAALHPEAVVHTCHSTDRLEQRVALDVPHLSSVFFRKKSIDDWAKSADGIDPSEVVFQIATQELLGAIEPIAAAGTHLGGGSAEAFVPVPCQIERLVRRTNAWVQLRRKANADKRIAVVYQDRGMNKADLMRGTATGMHLNAPRSVLAMLARMRDDGYTLRDAPADEAALIRMLLRSGRQVASGDEPALRELVDGGAPELLPVETYQRWLDELVPESARRQLLERWGPPPGDIMTTRDAAGRPCFVIPRIDLGGVVLLPQPLRGEAHDDKALHDKLTCPPHHYLATYLWLQRGLDADAVVHFGTHGSEFVLPGKSVGLGPDDWPTIVIGDLPNVSPWIVENLGEAMTSKRRSNAVLIGHLPPPAVDAGLADGLLRVHDDLDRFVTLGPGALKERFRSALTAAIREQRLDRDAGVEVADGQLLDDAQLQRVDDYLHRLAEETTPTSLHVLGQRPDDAKLIPHLVSCLGPSFRELLAGLGAGHGKADHARPAAEQLLGSLLQHGASVADALAAAGLAALATQSAEQQHALEEALAKARALWDGYGRTGNELDALLAALSGRFVVPGPGRGPMRNPGVLPTGRNLYSLNPDEVPSRPSWELGKQLADELIAQHVAEHGAAPTKVAFALSSFATFQDFGVMEAQILWLLGCEPIWDDRNLVRDVRVLSREELGRPRVDVYLSALSYYRDNLPSRMTLLDRAIREVAKLDEADNAVAAATRRTREQLLAAGESEARSEQLAAARIFGYAPGQASSADYYYLVERSTQWQDRKDLVQTYLDATAFVYTDGAWGERADVARAAAMQETSVVVRTWYDNATSPLANKYSWYTGGSLAFAIETVTGRRPDYVFNDVRDSERARVVDSGQALRDELRVRLFNRKWIEGMVQEGYAGADQMQVMVDNVFGWQTMREGSVDREVWDRIRSVYLEDELGIGLRQFFRDNNPFAEQRLVARMLEAVRKGYWQPERAVREALAQRYLDSVREFGPAGGFDSGKGVMRAYAESLAPVAAEASAAPVASGDASTPANAPSATAPDAVAPQRVRGQRLEPVAEAGERPFPLLGVGLALAAVACFVLGLLRRPT